MYLFKRLIDGVWIFGTTPKSVCQAGIYRLDPSSNYDLVTIHAIFNRDISLNYGTRFSDYLKENDQPYASLAEFEAGTTGFFIPQSTGIGGGEDDAVLSDTVDLVNPGWMQPLTTSGTVKYTTEKGNEMSRQMDVKELSPFRVKRVWLNGTTAGMGIRIIY